VNRGNRQWSLAEGSLAANIAEGYGRESAGAYAQQVKVAQGSLMEFETHVELAHRWVGLVDELTPSNVLKSSEEVGRMLRSLIRRALSPYCLLPIADCLEKTRNARDN
jgi:four helix bundle protein